MDAQLTAVELESRSHLAVGGDFGSQGGSWVVNMLARLIVETAGRSHDRVGVGPVDICLGRA